MGVEPFIVASALTGVIAQRLVRKICAACREEAEPDRARLEFARAHLGRDVTNRFFRGKGCVECQHTGFAGRLPIAELLEIDEGLRNLILEKAQTSTVRKFVHQRGWRTMLDDGIEKAIQGQTTLEEIFRVVSLKDIA
jgi:type II secretory ATPase GspE/PulE/Tfp pilus assembly ATPase PilB-like protein